jgi:hypothetical protein
MWGTIRNVQSYKIVLLDLIRETSYKMRNGLHWQCGASTFCSECGNQFCVSVTTISQLNITCLGKNIHHGQCVTVWSGCTVISCNDSNWEAI